MGIFTWTDAAVQNPKRNKSGFYRRKDILEYGKFGKIVCPDNTEIPEEHYGGYGMFGSKDAYEVVAEWNREELPEIFRKIVSENAFGSGLAEIASLFASGASDNEVSDFIKASVEAGKYPEYLITDWKRNLGIAIACDDRRNSSLRFPLKITTKREKVQYNDLYPSKSTQ